MDLLEFKKFLILIWKNFILKRRRFIALVVEMALTFIFGATLLAARRIIVIKKNGPFNYAAQPIRDVPVFIRNLTYPLELAYVPSKSVVVRDIVESVKMDLNPYLKG
ncbi:putative uncharacterized protein CRYM-AS1 [Carlito syrichta]|uniref:Uncharacterized protein n=1 Tax=Carlito syrichta TaxID=1868482 RepID=A0A3Q0ECQ8_CARSF|nr:putative uncharacterized protein CRYM-AS1 [Carlito syrichta]